MKNLPLSQSNPFLKDPVERRFWLFTTVTSSAAIEGVYLSKEVLKKLQEDWDSSLKPIYAVSSESPR